MYNSVLLTLGRKKSFTPITTEAKYSTDLTPSGNFKNAQIGDIFISLVASNAGAQGWNRGTKNPATILWNNKNNFPNVYPYPLYVEYFKIRTQEQLTDYLNFHQGVKAESLFPGIHFRISGNASSVEASDFKSLHNVPSSTMKSNTAGHALVWSVDRDQNPSLVTSTGTLVASIDLVYFKTRLYLTNNVQADTEIPIYGIGPSSTYGIRYGLFTIVS